MTEQEGRPAVPDAPKPGPAPTPGPTPPTAVPTPPRPTPVPPRPAPPASRGPVAPTPTPEAAPTPAPAADGPAPETFGRVGEDGTVYVRTANGERPVGQVPDATPDEALAFFVKRYEALAVTVDLLVNRVRSGSVAPDDAAHQIKRERKAITEANAVGDLDALLERLSSLAPALDEQREARRAEKAAHQQEAKQAKEKFVAQAEKLAAGNDWRHGVGRFRDLLEQWKQLPRIDKATDDELWHRFSSARSTYTRRRKAQFAADAANRDEAAKIKRSIIAEAEGLAGSTDWGPTSGAFRDLMQRWKKAGPAPREIDDELWKQFRGLQDQFFDARTAAQSEQDKEFTANQEAKEALLAQYEPRIAPTKDLSAAKEAFRELLDQWSEIGKVPRAAMRGLDQRMRSLESSIKKAEDDRWRKTNPEARARAEDTASKLRDQIASYEEKATKAEGRGDAKAAEEARRAAETYRTWLGSAEAAAEDFSG